MKYICIGKFVYGIGDTEEEAIQHAIEAGSPSNVTNRVLYTCTDDNACVGVFGDVQYHRDHTLTLIYRKKHGKKPVYFNEVQPI